MLKPLVLIGLGFSGSTAVLDGLTASGKCWSLPNKYEFDYLRIMLMGSSQYYKVLKSPLRILKHTYNHNIPVIEAWKWYQTERFFRDPQSFRDIETFFKRNISQEKQIILNQGIYIEQIYSIPKSWKKLIVIRHPYNSFCDIIKDGYFYAYNNLLDAHRCGSTKELMTATLISVYLKRLEIIIDSFKSESEIAILSFEELIRNPQDTTHQCEIELGLPHGSFYYHEKDALASKARQISINAAGTQLVEEGFSDEQLQLLNSEYERLLKITLGRY